MKTGLFKNKAILLQAPLMAFVSIATGCGANPSSLKSVEVSPSSVVSTSGAVATTTGSLVNELPPMTLSFDVTGPNGLSNAYTSSAVSTDNLLKVTLIANAQGYVEKSNQAVAMNCITYNVTVSPEGSTAGVTKTVLVSTTGKTGTGSCSGANPQPTLDFSSFLTAGHGRLVVKVAPTTTDNCRKYYFQTSAFSGTYGIGFGGCNLDVLYSTYHVTGVVQIHTNGTE